MKWTGAKWQKNDRKILKYVFLCEAEPIFTRLMKSLQLNRPFPHACIFIKRPPSQSLQARGAISNRRARRTSAKWKELDDEPPPHPPPADVLHYLHLPDAKMERRKDDFPSPGPKEGMAAGGRGAGAINSHQREQMWREGGESGWMDHIYAVGASSGPIFQPRLLQNVLTLKIFFSGCRNHDDFKRK